MFDHSQNLGFENKPKQPSTGIHSIPKFQVYGLFVWGDSLNDIKSKVNNTLNDAPYIHKYSAQKCLVLK